MVTFSNPTDANSLVQTVTFEVQGDLSVEPDETFEVVIPQAPVNAGLWQDRATGTIRGDDATIQGTVWHDANQNGVADAGDSGQAGVTVFLDSDEDGILDGGEVSVVSAADGSYQFTVAPGSYLVRLEDSGGQQQTFPKNISGSLEPDNFANGTVLNNVLTPEVTLTAVGNSIANGNVYAQTETYNSTSPNVFASTWNLGLWNTVDAELRIDFASNVNSVSVDAISDDSSDYAHLRAYDSAGTLLQEYVTGNLGTGVAETMTISRASNEISYVLAAGQTGQFTWLDNLVYSSLDDGSNVPLRVNVGPETATNNDFGVTTTEVLTLSINPGSFEETAGVGAATATVTRSSSTTDALTVTIASSDTGEAVAASQITIAAGQAQATFPIDAVDDLLVDNTQTVTFTVSAAGHTEGTATVDVTDNDQAILDYFYADTNFDGFASGQPGTIASGSIGDTHLDESSTPPQPTAGGLTLQEAEVQVGGNAKKPKMGSALEYHFSFPNLDSVSSFHAIASRPAGDDDFRIEYSTNAGASWTLLGTINQASDQSIDVDGLSLSGDLLVRVLDTDRSPSNGNSAPLMDSVFVKALHFEQAIYDLREPVTVTATADAQEHPTAPTNGAFTFSRNSNLGNLTVYYTVSGSATAGQDPNTDDDYVTLSGSVVIPDGSTDAVLEVVPLNNSVGEQTETVVVTLDEDASYGYRPAMPDSATVDILDDDLQTFTADAEITYAGDVTVGDYTATEAAGGAVETIQEYRTGGKPSNRITYMDHRWKFNAVEGAQSFYVLASRSDNAESDDFELVYGVDADGDWEPDSGSWSPLIGPINSSSLQLYGAPAGLSGDVIVKLQDTGPNLGGQTSQETVTIDHMYFSTVTYNPLQIAPQHAMPISAMHPATLAEPDLANFVQQAIAHWNLREPHAEVTRQLAETRFEVMPLGGNTVGLAFPQERRILIDTDAGGYGWHRVNLVDTLIHEIGHLYGHEHDVLGEFITPNMMLGLASRDDLQTRSSGDLLTGTGSYGLFASRAADNLLSDSSDQDDSRSPLEILNGSTSHRPAPTHTVDLFYGTGSTGGDQDDDPFRLEGDNLLEIKALDLVFADDDDQPLGRKLPLY
ncbi:MAG: hypothetical protein GTO62_03035 [Planctomycetales bacterium]|nr:hypothetical protein [Planctomycetales bacterium]